MKNLRYIDPDDDDDTNDDDEIDFNFDTDIIKGDQDIPDVS